MQALSRFEWPQLNGETVIWDDQQFSTATRRIGPVLPLCKTDSHWDDELTLLHEAEAGQGNHPIDVASRTLALSSLSQYVPSGFVIDVGCSSGFLLKDVTQQRPDLSVLGSDFLEPLLQRLSSRLPGVPLIQFDLTACPLPDNCVDAITCLNVLEHIKNDSAAIHEMYRILKPGGIAHIEVPASPICYDYFDEHLQHFRRYSATRLKTLVQDAGFEMMTFTHLGSFIFPLFFAVKMKNKLRGLISKSFNKEAHVKELLKASKQSRLLQLALQAELAIGENVEFPFGIRCVAVVRK
ncbi:MAG: class I SAM-dependent methyltransferase [Verrucomicrobiota bacterium]